MLKEKAHTSVKNIHLQNSNDDSDSVFIVDSNVKKSHVEGGDENDKASEDKKSENDLPDQGINVTFKNLSKRDRKQLQNDLAKMVEKTREADKRTIKELAAEVKRLANLVPRDIIEEAESKELAGGNQNIDEVNSSELDNLKSSDHDNKSSADSGNNISDDETNNKHSGRNPIFFFFATVVAFAIIYSISSIIRNQLNLMFM